MEKFWLGSPDVSPAGLSPQKRIRRDEDVSFSSEDDQQSTTYANLLPEIPDPAKPVTLDEALDLSQFQPQAPHDQGLDLINVNTIYPTDPLAPDKHGLRDRPFDCIHQTCQIMDQSETQSSTIECLTNTIERGFPLMAGMSGDPEEAHTGAHDLWHDFDVGIMPLAVGKDCVYIKGGAQDPATFVPWTTIFNTQYTGSNQCVQ
ncbi:hypothetical protein F5883DRAFT_570173 [Diaporthe sp. PMI_573]|nr:hypothetical protein F5883DRAFT_570173 [Diaporthaceae sp. PMI_573]